MNADRNVTSLSATPSQAWNLAYTGVRDILASYFRHLDVDVPACATDICALFNDDSLYRDALWRQVDRQWGERWLSDQRAHERIRDAVEGYLLKQSKYGDDDATALLAELFPDAER